MTRAEARASVRATMPPIVRAIVDDRLDEHLASIGVHVPNPPVILTPAAQVRHMREYKLVKSFRRMYRLGLGAGLMRKTINLRGSFFARHRWLIPLLPVMRIVLAGVRVARYSSRGNKLDFLLLSPMVFLFWSCYSVGFAAGAFGYVEKRFRLPAKETAQ